jgi:hypothetical protein
MGTFGTSGQNGSFHRFTTLLVMPLPAPAQCTGCLERMNLYRLPTLIGRALPAVHGQQFT